MTVNGVGLNRPALIREISAVASIRCPSAIGHEIRARDRSALGASNYCLSFTAQTKGASGRVGRLTS
jgi:hypothetical protein